MLDVIANEMTMKYCKGPTSSIFQPFKQDSSEMSFSFQFSLKMLLQDALCFCTLPLQLLSGDQGLQKAWCALK